MEAFSVTLPVWNPAEPGDTEEFEAQVDAGSMFSWISRARLERLGVVPSGRMSIRGREREIASVFIAMDDGPVGDVVVVAEADEVEVVGEHTINAFGLAVDSRQKKFVPKIMWALSSSEVAAA